MITSSPQLFPRLGASSCTWVISLSVGRRVRLWFDALRMDGDSIIIRDGNDSSAAKIVTIKDDKFKRAIISTGSSMYIFYWHNGRWTNGTRRGFTASYRVEGMFFSMKITYCIFSLNGKYDLGIVMVNSSTFMTKLLVPIPLGQAGCSAKLKCTFPVEDIPV